MKYLLCAINAKYIHSNLAVLSLKAFAGKYGPPEAEYIIREYTINHYMEDILADLYEVRADVLVFSCYIWNIRLVRELAEEYKKILPGAVIWMGGPEVSYDARPFLREFSSVDLVMQGEGEEQFTGMVYLWEEYGDLEKIPPEKLPQGIAVRGRINPFAAPVDLDRIPFVYGDFHLFDHKILYYETSRGCPFRCSYCLSSADQNVRFRSLKLVFSEISTFLKEEVLQVKFVDRTFNCRSDRAMSIWQYILDHDNGITNFHFEISADLLREEDLALFARMRPGLIQLEIGLQSTNPATLESIRRKTDLRLLFAHVDRVRDMGNIHQHIDLIAGLPHESFDRFRISFNDLYIHGPDQIQLGFLKLLKGTYMEMMRDEYGMAARSQPPYEVLKNKWIDYGDMLRLKGVEDMVETYYNSMQFSETLKYAIRFFPSPFDFYDLFAAWYRKNGYHRINHNRAEKYEILRSFLLEEAAYSPIQEDFLDDLLLLDMYLREDLKKRPAWAPGGKGKKDRWRQLFRDQGEVLFPEQVRDGSYHPRTAANACHIEEFSFDVSLWMQDGRLRREPVLCLFDYRCRNPLNHNAAIRIIHRQSLKNERQ